MGMKRNIILAVCGFFCVFIGIVLGVAHAMQDDKKQNDEAISSVLRYYQKLEVEANAFNEKKKEYAEIVLGDLYDESVLEEYSNWIQTIVDYQEIVDAIVEISQPLNQLCNQTYGDNDANNACKSYQISYETCMNYFVKDIEEFNTFIDSYLARYSDTAIKRYELDSNKYYYIDVDLDGEFVGKN
ncbi:MAG: hypothetical protein PUB18_00660 [bacterium]|nr:hypothetical protein [bacterium]